MGLTPEELEDLLALASLGLLDAADEEALDSVDLEADGPAAARHTAFQRTVAMLDQTHAIAPPPELRDRVLSAALARPPQRVTPAPPPELFARQVAALAELLGSLDDDAWRRAVPPYEWTVHGLIAHLLVIENYTAYQLGLTPDGPAEAHHLAMGAEERALEERGPPGATAQRWLSRAEATVAALNEANALPRDLTLHGWPFSLEGAVIARSFELWTHAEDIRRATGRPAAAATPADLRTMSSFSVQVLPLTLALVERDRVLTPTRIVLTGPGGGTFDLLEGVGGFDTLIVADVVDYCRVVARRIRPDELDCTIEGDAPLARALLLSAGVFAV